MTSPLLLHPAAFPAIHPNTPVMPFATPTKKASYLDPTVHIKNGHAVVISYQSYIAPYVTLDARHRGAIKIGAGSDVLDSAQVIANPAPGHRASEVLIGDQVSIGYGATILGPSTIGGYESEAKPTQVGAGALIDAATIEPGAIVSPRARVGPGVTVPSGFRVLPGKNVTTDAQASNPKLGMVVRVSSSDTASLKQTLTASQGLAAGYTNLYQGNSATGVNPGANPAIGGINNGNLATVLGASQSPGPSFVAGTMKVGPQFLTPHQGLVSSLLANFPARITGLAQFNMRPLVLSHHLGRANSIRADLGQPIAIASIARTGLHVTINSPPGGKLSIGQNLRAGSGAIILGGPNATARIGDNVTIGSDAVVQQTSLGSGSSVGEGAYLLGSSFPANTVIPAKAIYINNAFEGYVEW
jgi:carbonic anhydrase/acetyltransferase-like protein (isoleucine patch superfamily)